MERGEAARSLGLGGWEVWDWQREKSFLPMLSMFAVLQADCGGRWGRGEVSQRAFGMERLRGGLIECIIAAASNANFE